MSNSAITDDLEYSSKILQLLGLCKGKVIH